MAGDPRAVIERDGDGRWSWWIEIIDEDGGRWGPVWLPGMGPSRFLHWGVRRTARWSARRRLRQYAAYRRRLDEGMEIINDAPSVPSTKEPTDHA
jgi:hypothetical protein